ncbi:MAG: hypothetical protein KF789_08490 [Bdellovibrionaceae bacterium]|nr:hypothetical protein [Pseudobdellovibrionaceae bacterium]
MSEDELAAKAPLVRAFVQTLDPKEIESVHLHLVGGELLQDRLLADGWYLEQYRKIVLAFDQICQEFGFAARTFLVTNLLFKKNILVNDWLGEMNRVSQINLIVSYDSSGRPITKQYFENLTMVKTFVSNLNVVATNRTLRKLLDGDPRFEELYENFDIFIDDFLPDKSTEGLIPSDELFLEFLQKFVGSHPGLLPYGPLFQKIDLSEWQDLQFATYNKCTILPDGTMTNYLWPRHHQEHFRFDLSHADNSNFLAEFLDYHKCLSCEYFRICPLRCPVSWAWRKPGRDFGCVNKAFFDSARLKPSRDISQEAGKP